MRFSDRPGMCPPAFGGSLCGRPGTQTGGLTMSRIDVIRAWKDESYRLSLSDAERASLPQNPAGSVELTGAEAAAVEGGLAALACGCGCHTKGFVLNNYAAVMKYAAVVR